MLAGSTAQIVYDDEPAPELPDDAVVVPDATVTVTDDQDNEVEADEAEVIIVDGGAIADAVAEGGAGGASAQAVAQALTQVSSWYYRVAQNMLAM